MKIDITKMKGYSEELTAEEKLKLYESYEFEENHDGYIKKDLFDKTTSELADYKKQLKAKMTEDEQKAQAEAEEREKMVKELESLRRDKSISETKALYLSLGYDEELASDSAMAMADGDKAKLFANQKKFIEGKEKAIRAEALGNTPRPPAGDGDTSPMTKEKFLKMSTKEQLEYKSKNENWQELK